MERHESKNKRRKRQRARYYQALNALGGDWQDAQAIHAATMLFAQYCDDVDEQIEKIGASTSDWCEYLQHILTRHEDGAQRPDGFLVQQSLTHADMLPEMQDALCHRDENDFINRLLRQLDHNGWVRIDTPEGTVQARLGIDAYIKAKEAVGDRESLILARVARHLHERALRKIRPKHV